MLRLTHCYFVFEMLDKQVIFKKSGWKLGQMHTYINMNSDLLNKYIYHLYLYTIRFTKLDDVEL